MTREEHLKEVRVDVVKQIELTKKLITDLKSNTNVTNVDNIILVDSKKYETLVNDFRRIEILVKTLTLDYPMCDGKPVYKED